MRMGYFTREGVVEGQPYRVTFEWLEDGVSAKVLAVQMFGRRFRRSGTGFTEKNRDKPRGHCRVVFHEGADRFRIVETQTDMLLKRDQTGLPFDQACEIAATDCLREIWPMLGAAGRTGAAQA